MPPNRRVPPGPDRSSAAAIVSSGIAEASEQQVLVGRIAGIFGVKGWVRVFSYTNPPENILRYAPWSIGDERAARYEVTDGAAHGRGTIAHLRGVDDREAARTLIGSPIRVPRECFGKAGKGEYYWFDLLGLEVVNEDGESLGRVDQLLETGANDVLVVRGARKRLVPFVKGSVIKQVDLEAGVIRVSWDADF